MTINTKAIEIFVAVAKTRNISEASRLLFISQSAASTQLKSLEAELSVQLFNRQKGINPITLTDEGMQFLPIAQKMLLLYSDSMSLKKPDHCSLYFSCVDTLNTYLFPPFFNHFSHTHRNIHLQISTQNSHDIMNAVEGMVADFGIIFVPERRENLIIEPYFSENMYVVMKQKQTSATEIPMIKPTDLDFDKEICNWMGDNYLNWRNQWCQSQPIGYMRVWTIPLMLRLLTRHGQWGAIPESLVPEIQQHEDLTVYQLTDPPPKRIAYKVKLRQQPRSKAEFLKQFEGDMDKFIARKGLTMYSH